jgi:hypothetical protein
LNYDWRETVLNRWLLDWLQWREDNRLIVVGKETGKIISRHVDLKYGFQRAAGKHQLFVHEKGAGEISVNDLSSFLK